MMKSLRKKGRKAAIISRLAGRNLHSKIFVTLSRMNKQVIITLFLVFCVWQGLSAQQKDSDKVYTRFEPPSESQPVFKVDTGAVYEFTDQPATFPGGQDAFINFLKYNLKYPDYAVKHHIEGTVFISGTVKSDGQLKDLKVLKGNDYLTEEAIRVLKQSPLWVPGKMNGTPVHSKVIIPVSFKLK